MWLIRRRTGKWATVYESVALLAWAASVASSLLKIPLMAEESAGSFWAADDSGRHHNKCE